MGTTLQEVFDEFRNEEQMLLFRHPGFNLVYNWVVAILALALLISLGAWGMDLRTERRAEAMTALAMAAWQSEQDAVLQAEAAEQEAIRSSQEYVMRQEATALAKAFYGVRNFTEKYHYTAADLETYARAAFNRADAGANGLEAILSKPEQFLAYSDSNPVLDENYTLALRLVQQWHEEETKPCDLSYQYAELTPDGIFLKADLHADGYARRWRA